MKLTVVLFSLLVTLTGCGVDLDRMEASSSTKASGDSFYVSPLGITSSCLQATPSSAGLLAIMGTCSGISPLRIRYMTGTPYRPGGDGNVTISYDGQCLTNPAVYGGGAQDAGNLVFKPCNDDGTEYGLRQMFAITRNANGATQIASNLQYMLTGIANPRRECLERPTPGSVKRTTCSGLGNWQTWQ